MEMGSYMSVSAVARIAGINDDSVWRILKHYVDEARKSRDLSDPNISGIDEFFFEKHHVYVALFYDTKNARVIHIGENESDGFLKFMTKHLPLIQRTLNTSPRHASFIHIRRQGAFL